MSQQKPNQVGRFTLPPRIPNQEDPNRIGTGSRNLLPVPKFLPGERPNPFTLPSKASSSQPNSQSQPIQTIRMDEESRPDRPDLRRQDPPTTFTDPLLDKPIMKVKPNSERPAISTSSQMPRTVPQNRDKIVIPIAEIKDKKKPPKRRRSLSPPGMSSPSRRVSTLVTDDANKFEMGTNIPKSVMREIIKDISGVFGEYKISKVAIEFLHLASEWRLTERFKMATHITRARQRKTLSRVDLETVDLIENDMFLRRKSCPTNIELVIQN